MDWQRLLTALQSFYGQHLAAAGIFGSWVTGNQVATSDIDLFLVVENAGMGMRRYHDILAFLDEHFPFLDISPTIVDRNNAQSMQNLYFGFADGLIVLYDPQGILGDILHRVHSALRDGEVEKKRLVGIDYWVTHEEETGA